MWRRQTSGSRVSREDWKALLYLRRGTDRLLFESQMKTAETLEAQKGPESRVRSVATPVTSR